MRLASPISLAMPMAILGISTIQGAAAACSEGLVNVVFNLGNGNPGYTPGRWKQINAANWITFNTGTAYKQIPMLGDSETRVDQAISIVNGTNPPDYMLTFNEPDNLYNSPIPGTLHLQPKDAARLMNKLLTGRGNHTHTKFIAPVPAFEKSNWLPEFYGNCSCQDVFAAYNIHVYNYSMVDVKKRVNEFHNKWNDKPIWITEISRRSEEQCPNPIPWNKTTDFMRDLFKWAEETEWIEKVFWNSADQIHNCTDTNVAASFLLDLDSKPSPLLAPFNSLTCS